MTVMLSLHAGYDVGYLTDAVGAGGADYYLSAAGKGGEPPGFWTGKGAQALGLAGEVNADVMRALYHENVTPEGEALNIPQRPSSYAGMRETVEDRIEAEVARRAADLGDPTERELGEIRLMVAAQQRNAVPFFDFTLSVAKSISVTAASYQAAAKAARDHGDEAAARACMAKVRAVEDAVREGARQVVRSAERHAAYVRTGHHGQGQGQWRDAAGLVAAVFLQHTSRDADPQLHAHVAVLNRAQRADAADSRWRTLDSRSLHRERLGLAARAGMVVEQRLLAAGFSLVQREDGNGREIEGVSPATMRAFSSRRTAITPAIRQLVDEYTQIHGRAPSRRALWSLRQWATLQTRRGKHEIERTAAESLATWEQQSAAGECQILADVRAAVEEFGQARTAVAPSTEDVHRAVRIAVHEVQRQNATWTASQLAWELFRAMPPRDAASDPLPLLTGMLQAALLGRVDGAEVVSLAPAPDVTDVSMLGVRQSDGVSVYRPPGEARYCTADMLDTEEWLVNRARRKVPQEVLDDEADSAASGGGLSPNQSQAVRGLLTATTATTVLIGPAGSGKTFVMSRFAAAWARVTGRRVIGLAASTNAARQLAREGMTTTYNIAQFLGRLKDTDATRGHVPVHAGDVLVIDEASQLSTADLAAIQRVADSAGARIILTGDTAQLGPVEAGGIMAEIAKRQGYWKLHEVRRFHAAWEARASLALRDGDMRAWLDYKVHGRIRSGPQDTAYAKAVELWVTDHLAERESLLMAGSNAEAADLARMARDLLVSYRVLDGKTEITLSDGNEAGTGDLVRARLNCRIDAGGQRLTNRDVLRIDGWRLEGPSRVAVASRRVKDGWSAQFEVPASYLGESAELAYAGNVHVAQSRTVDTGHLVVSETLNREALYVGMSRGQAENTAHVVTGAAQVPGGKVVEQAPAEAVLAGAMQREDSAATAHQVVRDAQAFSSNSRHLVELWQALVRPEAGRVDEAVRARIGETEFERYLTDPQRPVFQQLLRQAELAGHDLDEVVGQATTGGFEGARSIAAVLHGRVERLGLEGGGRTATWAERTPRTRAGQSPPASEWRQALDEIVSALDHRQVELGVTQLEQPEPWAMRTLGVPPAEAGPLRDDWMARVGRAASYREAAGITDPEQAVGNAPQRNPELLEAWQSSLKALEIEEQFRVRGAQQAELEVKVREYERAKVWAPERVGRDLELTAQAERDAEAQAAAARARDREALALSAEALQATMGAARERLEAKQAMRDDWEQATVPERSQARDARAELDRRGVQAEPELDRDELEPEPERITKPEPEVEVEAEPVRDEIDVELDRIQDQEQAKQRAERDRVREAREAEAERYEAERSQAAWQAPEITQREAEVELELDA